MILQRSRHGRSCRRGVATVEASVLLSLLILLVLGVCELGRYVYCAQVLNNAARQGARAAVSHTNSNAEVEAAVYRSMKDSMGLDSDAVNVRISALGSNGAEQYQVMSLDENEQGEAVRVTVSVDYGKVGFASNLLGLKDMNLSSYAVMERQE